MAAPIHRFVLAVAVVVVALAACTSGSGPRASSTRITGAGSSASPTSAAPSAGQSDPAPASSSPALRSTEQQVVRPVDTDGRLAAGFTARTNSTAIVCGGLRSPVSVSADVQYCSPSAASAVACWHAADRAHAYCLLDPRATTVVDYPLTGSAFPATRPTETPPAPMSLDLAGGTRCATRVGGAAGQLAAHPDWVPYYYCGAGDADAAWGPPDAAGGGVTRGDGAWTVQLGRGDGTGTLRTVAVARAIFVGTAAG